MCFKMARGGIVVGKDLLVKKMMRAKKQTCPNIIVNRISTMINGISKFLAEVPDEVFTLGEAELKCSLLNLNGKCEYCETNPARTEDHLFPLVKNRCPTDACNDKWNMVPSCGSCNSSKGKLSLEEWITKNTASNPFPRMDDETRARIVEKLRKYARVADERRYRKTFDIATVKQIIDDLVTALQLSQGSTALVKKTTTFRKGKLIKGNDAL